MNDEITRNQIAVIGGWFTTDPKDPRLVGNRCKTCGDYYFPKASSCRNPDCIKDDLEEVLLSQNGKLWSFTNNHYPPPSPYVSPPIFVPYSIVVVELAEEKLMVMGQLADGYDYATLKVGLEMELVVEPLYIDDQENEHTIWKWKPLLAANSGSEIGGSNK